MPGLSGLTLLGTISFSCQHGKIESIHYVLDLLPTAELALSNLYHIETVNYNPVLCKPYLMQAIILYMTGVYDPLYRIVGNFRGRKLLQISHFVAIRESFLHEIWKYGILWCSKSEQSMLHENRTFHQLAKIFSPESFSLYGTLLFLQ